MIFLIPPLLLLAALLLPVTLQGEVYHHEHSRGRITIRILGIHKTRHFPQEKHAGLSLRLQSWQQRKRFGAWLLHRIRLVRLDVLILLHSGDAARTALLTGAMQLLAAFPREQVHLRILPDFFRPQSTLQARCIIRVRLGILLLTMMLLPIMMNRQPEREA